MYAPCSKKAKAVCASCITTTAKNQPPKNGGCGLSESYPVFRKVIYPADSQALPSVAQFAERDQFSGSLVFLFGSVELPVVPYVLNVVVILKEIEHFSSFV